MVVMVLMDFQTNIAEEALISGFNKIVGLSFSSKSKVGEMGNFFFFFFFLDFVFQDGDEKATPHIFYRFGLD
ncbi:hypothetical protein Csa_021168 [Cucumis sativus]|uniref:Uncharacterized protein n=1 Tax=Cucumis sativus TaxID=3659 RepID=A0A0A0LGI5_CUCSA|nr:hypothetical protein Csa_021168 [Cucumis sativus]